MESRPARYTKLRLIATITSCADFWWRTAEVPAARLFHIKPRFPCDITLVIGRKKEIAVKQIGDAVEYVFHAVFGTLCLLLLYAVALLLGCFGVSLEGPPKIARRIPPDFSHGSNEDNAGNPVASHGNA